MEHALPLDYAFLRAYRADAFGNLQYRRTQRNFNPQSVRIYHSNSDHKAVCAILERLVEPSSDVFPAYYRLMKLRAEALVQNDVNWSAIEILARELLQRRTLKGSALREFISSRCFGLHEVVSPVR